MVLVSVYLVIIGLCAGSFVNALVWRIKEQSKEKNKKAINTKLSILSGRSICPSCKHQLSSLDLVPVLSWLALKGKCRYCQKPISRQYPIVEMVTALVFVLSYVFWPETLAGGEWLVLGTWLVSSVGLMALAVYDIRWMLLPNRILYPTFFVALAGQLGYIAFFAADKANSLEMIVCSILVAAGIFWVLFHLSNGKWIGYGDVRLGLVTGTLLASPWLSLLMIFVASLLGTLYSLPLMATGRQKLAGKIPFGPFLIAATALVILFGQAVIDWYSNTLI